MDLFRQYGVSNITYIGKFAKAIGKSLKKLLNKFKLFET